MKSPAENKHMTVMEKIAERRKEMKVAKGDQGRKKNGRFDKKRDSFLLWGEYPTGWQMIKDGILCIMLVSALIGHLQKVNWAEVLAPETIVYVNEHTPIAEAKESTPEPKTSPEAKSEATEDIEKTAKGEFSAYSSEVAQTDADPFTMASGKRVYDGAIANNCLPFGTKVKVNGKTKIVEDRMNKRYGCDHFDIWMEEKSDAIAFGRKNLSYEIVK